MTLEKKIVIPLILTPDSAIILTLVPSSGMFLSVVNLSFPFFWGRGCFYFLLFRATPEAHASYQPGFTLELQPLNYTTGTATPDPRLIYDVYHSSWQCQILTPKSEARDQTYILMDTSWVCNPMNHNRNSCFSVPLVDESLLLLTKSYDDIIYGKT